MQAWGLLRPLWPLSQVEFTPRQGSEWCGFTPSEKQKKDLRVPSVAPHFFCLLRKG